jgi:hypothetical protein
MIAQRPFHIDIEQARMRNTVALQQLLAPSLSKYLCGVREH